MLQRRNFVRLIGGGAVAAAGAGALAGCSLSPALPAEAVEIWRGPGAETDVRRRAIAYAITAPNPHNLQPWLLDLREPDAITLRCDTTRLLPHTDPFGRQILIGHGAFIELLVMALAAQGVRGEVALWPEGEPARELAGWGRQPVARIALTPGAPADPLFAQVLRRRSPKSRFDTARPVTDATLQRLVDAVPSTDRLRAGGTVEPGRVDPLRALCLAAGRTELLTPATVLESMRLMRIGPDEILRHRDGISINAPMARLFTALGQFDRERPAPAESAAFGQALQRFADQSDTAMGFVWIASARNRRTDQIEVGRAFVRQQLQATALDVGLHPMSQALQEFVEMAPHYEAVHRQVLGLPAPRGTDEPTLQMLCRVGYSAAPVAAAPRRPLAQFTGAAAA